jgi:nitroreductase
MVPERIVQVVDTRFTARVDFDDVVRRRRTVRAYDGRPLAPGVADRLVRTALRGPSAGFTQGVELLVLERPEDRARYWAAALPPERRPRFHWPGLLDAPLLVVVFGHPAAYAARYAEPDKGGPPAQGEWPAPWWFVDAAFAALLLALAAVDQGLGSAFFAVHRADAVRAAFGVPDGYLPVGTVAAGHPAPDRPSTSLARGRRPPDTVVHRGRWGRSGLQ